MRGAVSLWALCAVLGAASAAAQSAQPAAPVRVRMQTGAGELELELYPQRAPITAGGFLRLVDSGALDGGSFYRAVTAANDRGKPVIEVIQGGLRERADAQPALAHETTEQTGIRHEDGVISMARGAVGSARSEFFICIGDQPGLDFGNTRNADKQGFAAFGRVVRGMDVVRAIQRRPAAAPSDSEYTAGQILSEPVPIWSVRRVDAAPAPER